MLPPIPSSAAPCPAQARVTRRSALTPNAAQPAAVDQRARRFQAMRQAPSNTASANRNNQSLPTRVSVSTIAIVEDFNAPSGSPLMFGATPASQAAPETSASVRLAHARSEE